MAVGLGLSGALAPMVGHANGGSTYGGNASLGTGLVVQARPRTSSLRTVEVRFLSGARVKLRASAHEREYATYVGDLGPDKQYFGVLEIPAHKASGTFHLRYRPQAQQHSLRVTAVLTTGSKPALLLSGFPAGTTRFELSTAGAGTAATKTTTCDGKLSKYRGSMTITLRSGTKEKGLASGEVSCAKLPPAG